MVALRAWEATRRGVWTSPFAIISKPLYDSTAQITIVESLTPLRNMDSSSELRRHTNDQEPELSPLEQEVLDEYAKLVGNLDNVR